jgi:hypothetical protein
MAATISNTYTDTERLDIIKRICGLIIQSSVEKACEDVGIAESTFYAWIASDDTLAEEYGRVRLPRSRYACWRSAGVSWRIPSDGRGIFHYSGSNCFSLRSVQIFFMML